jgi:aspartate kinase
MWSQSTRRHRLVQSSAPLLQLTSLTLFTGFFGPVPGSLLRQIGRGYTDLLSAVLSAGLKAAELQIWKEVDGVFTADPRKVPTARLIPVISPDEAAELTYYGSEVIHHFAMEQVCPLLSSLRMPAQLFFWKMIQAIREMIPIRIKNVENPDGGGTVISPDPEVDVTLIEDEDHSTPDFPLASLNPFPRGDEKKKKLPTAVTIKEHIIVLNVNSNRKSVSHGFLAGIFGTLDRFGVVVDLISTSEVHISMAIEDGLGKKSLERLVSDLKKNGTVSFRNITLDISKKNDCAGHRPSRYGHSIPRRKTNA